MTINRTNEKLETLMSFDKALLMVNYYWNADGNYVLWNSQVERKTIWTDAKVEISKISFTQNVSGLSFDFEATQLKVDGIALGGDVLDVDVELMADGTVLVACKLIVGWG